MLLAEPIKVESPFSAPMRSMSEKIKEERFVSLPHVLLFGGLEYMLGVRKSDILTKMSSKCEGFF